MARGPSRRDKVRGGGREGGREGERERGREGGEERKEGREGKGRKKTTFEPNSKDLNANSNPTNEI